MLEPYLTGKAQKAFYSLCDIDKCDYNKIVEVIHQRYFLTPEEYRLKYKSDTKKADETFSAKCEDVDTKRALNPVMIDQFLSPVRDEQLRLKLREKKFVSLSTAAKAADEFLLHRRSNATTKPSPNKPFSRTGTPLPKLSDKPDARSPQTTTGRTDTTPGQSWSRKPDQPR